MKNILLVLSLVVALQSNGQWLNCNPTSSSVQPLVAAGGKIFIGDFVTGVHYTTDNGDTWHTKNNSLNPLHVTSLLVHNSDIFAGLWANGGVFRSDTDGNSNWSAVNNGTTSGNVHDLASVGNAIFRSTNTEGISRSTDNGNTWNTVNNGITNLTLTSLVAKGSRLFAGGFGVIFMSSDNGDSWTLKNTGLPQAGVRSLATDGTYLFAGTTTGIYMSADDGDSWVSINNGIPNYDIFTVHAAPGYLLIGTTNKVYLSLNNGISWGDITDNIPNGSINGSLIHNNTIFIGTASGIWRRSLPGVNNVLELPVEQFTCYPSVSNAKFYLEGTAYKDCSFEITDISGIPVLLGRLNSKKTELDLSDQAKGMYLYKVIWKGLTLTTGKVILN